MTIYIYNYNSNNVYIYIYTLSKPTTQIASLRLLAFVRASGPTKVWRGVQQRSSKHVVNPPQLVHDVGEAFWVPKNDMI